MNGAVLDFPRGAGLSLSVRWRWPAVVVLLVVPIVVAWCGGGGGGGGNGVEGTGASVVAASRSDSGANELLPVSWRFTPPPAWDERVRVSEDPEGERALRAQGIRSARLFEYLPRDTTIVPQTLLGIYAYDSTAWARLAAAGGPPQGELLLQQGGVSYVAGLPQSNPFAPGTADHAEFERRAVDLTYVRGAFRVVP